MVSHQTSNSSGPLSQHPLFPAAVALWFAILLGCGSLALSPALLERAVLMLGVDRVIPAAAPPLGFTARILLALTLGAAGALAGYASALRLAGRSPSAAGADGQAPAGAIVVAPPADEADDNEDLARLDAARAARPARRRPLVYDEPEGAAVTVSAVPAFLAIDELAAIPPLGPDRPDAGFAPPPPRAPVQPASAPAENQSVDELIARFAQALALRRRRASAPDGPEAEPAPLMAPTLAGPTPAGPADRRPFDMPAAVRASELNPAEWPAPAHAQDPDPRAARPPAGTGDDDSAPFGSLLDIRPPERAHSVPAPIPAPDPATPAETEAALRQALVTLQKLSGTA